MNKLIGLGLLTTAGFFLLRMVKVEATVRKLMNDKLIPNLIGDTTQSALNWIKKQHLA